MKIPASSKVVIAMSGGVDSSVAAALLVGAGYQVTGIMLRLWSEPGLEADNRCCTPRAMALARRVAASLEIPFYVMDVREAFHDRIVDYFLDGYAAGLTPNPCMMCNRHIRFGALLSRARALGADYVATGHYARLRKTKTGRIQLLRAVDAQKDQSYVLSVLDQAQLRRALFPIGEYPKTEVREMADRFGLPVAHRSDSQDLCFLAGGDYREFLQRHIPDSLTPGRIMSRSGEQLGTHRGLAFYTIGQRKGLGIAASKPLYVLEKDPVHNDLVVGGSEDLGQDELLAEQGNWIAGRAPKRRFSATVKIRYQSREVPAAITPLPDDHIHIRFERPVRDVTPGQWAVIFDDQQVLGSGKIVH